MLVAINVELFSGDPVEYVANSPQADFEGSILTNTPGLVLLEIVGLTTRRVRRAGSQGRARAL